MFNEKKIYNISAMVVQCIPALVLDSLSATSMLDGLVCMMAGTVKVWWDRQTPEAKRYYKARTASWRKALCAAVTVLCGLFVAFLWSNTELDPVTGRRRLFLYDELLLERKANHDVTSVIMCHQMFGKLLDSSHPTYKRVAEVATRLVDANVDVAAVRDRQWCMMVVADQKPGAFVTNNGIIFVTTSQVDDVNDDQLSIIVGHEMSHCIQRHTNEKMSTLLMFNVARLVSVVVIWAVLPFFWALFTQMLMLAFQHVFVELPLSRVLEMEADRDGFMMAAKAGVNVAEGSRYWHQMDERTNGKSDRAKWMCTHPSHSTRAHHLSALVPEARELQKSVGCNASPENSTAGR